MANVTKGREYGAIAFSVVIIKWSFLFNSYFNAIKKIK